MADRNGQQTADEYGGVERGKRRVQTVREAEAVINNGAPPLDEIERSIAQVAQSVSSQPAEVVSPDRVRVQIGATIDLAAQHVIERIRACIKELQELESFVISDGTRCKDELLGHMDLANAAAAHVDNIEATMRDIRAKQARLVRSE